MKRYTVLLSTLALAAGSLLSVVPLGAQSGGLRYSIVVNEFENRAGWSGRWDLGDAWGTVLTDMLSQTGRFIVLGEQDMRAAALDEQDFAASGRTAGGAKAPETGQMTPAQLIVKGAITHVEETTSGGRGGISIRGIRVGGGGSNAEMNVTIYVVDSTTGQVVASKSVVGESSRGGLRFGYSGHGFSGDAEGFKNDNVGKAVEAAASEAVEFILGQLSGVPWTGTVAHVAGDRVYINRGEREGVRNGQVFVVGDSEVIRDPDTGEVLDTLVTELARLEVVEVRDKLSIARVSGGDAASIRRGMGVSLP